MQKFFIQRALGSNETVEHLTHIFSTLFCRAVTWLLCHKYFIFSTDFDSKDVENPISEPSMEKYRVTSMLKKKTTWKAQSSVESKWLILEKFCAFIDIKAEKYRTP